MKFVMLLAFVVVVVTARPEEDDDYSRYDNFDVDEVLTNPRLMRAYLDCLHGIGKCTPEGADLKRWVPSGVQNKCSKCSEKQKPFVAKSILAIQEQFPEDWETLNKEHNPEGKYDEDLKEFLQKYRN